MERFTVRRYLFTVAAYTLKHRLKCTYALISHFLSRSNSLTALAVSHPHLVVFIYSKLLVV